MDHVCPSCRRSADKHCRCYLPETSVCPHNSCRSSSSLSLLKPIHKQAVAHCSLTPVLFHTPVFALAEDAWKLSLASESRPSPGSLCVKIALKVILKRRRELERKPFYVHPSKADVAEVTEFSVILGFSVQSSFFQL